ncbi:MAG: peptidylprolyl isomerase [Acidimicrobiia bacterium]|nr:peptidylprolyl isomerase [Acidimicrobiia bacterium]
MPTDKRERQRANRAEKQATQQKQARREKTRRTITRWVAIVAIVVGGLYLLSLRGGDDTPDSTTIASAASTTAATDAATTTLATTEPADSPITSDPGPTSYDGYRAQTTACGGTQPQERTEMTFDAPVDQALTGTVSAVIATSCGDITLALDADAYPETVNSFVFLAQEGFFDGTACHRFPDGFVLQCGDPTATGTGDPGYEIPDEFPDAGFAYSRGVVAMANSGPGSTGSQFFIVTGDATQLGPEFSILGTVVGSEQTLAALDDVPRGLQPTGEPSAPLETIYIESVAITS